MAKQIFKESGNKPINDELANLESFKIKVQEIKKEQDQVIKQIRQGFVESVVIFIDLVDSTKFKIENKDEPEKWILRVKQFSDIVKEYIENSNGKVVKYIGDEVMGIFDQKTQVDDALSLILRIRNIEGSLSEITGFATNVKIALDYGKVILLRYDGHNELDPQGTPVDRCARIGKYCNSSTILSSYEFVSKCAFPKQWHKLGNVEMKGLGLQPIYQYGEQTVELKKKIEIEEDEFLKLKESNSSLQEEKQTLELDKTELVSTVTQLQEQLRKAGEKPVIETDFSEKSDDEEMRTQWKALSTNFREIKKLIYGAGVSANEYGRFLFLDQKGLGDKYNSYEGKTFDGPIEKGLVLDDSDGYFVLNEENKRNIKIKELLDKTEIMMTAFVSEYGPLDTNELFEYSFSDPDFWSKYLGIIVTW